jgi:hypothetical protein
MQQNCSGEVCSTFYRWLVKLRICAPLIEPGYAVGAVKDRDQSVSTDGCPANVESSVTCAGNSLSPSPRIWYPGTGTNSGVVCRRHDFVWLRNRSVIDSHRCTICHDCPASSEHGTVLQTKDQRSAPISSHSLGRCRHGFCDFSAEAPKISARAARELGAGFTALETCVMLPCCTMERYELDNNSHH